MKKTIVLIDDDQDDLDILREVILKHEPSFDCVSFINPAEAIKVICEDFMIVPDYLFIDINMPGMPGDKCVSELRKREELNNSVIAVLSTSIPPKVAETLKQLGADYTFQKPSSMEAYNKILNSVFSHSLTA